MSLIIAPSFGRAFVSRSLIHPLLHRWQANVADTRELRPVPRRVVTGSDDLLGDQDERCASAHLLDQPNRPEILLGAGRSLAKEAGSHLYLMSSP
jgi:hypothetical protein